MLRTPRRSASPLLAPPGTSVDGPSRPQELRSRCGPRGPPNHPAHTPGGLWDHFWRPSNTNPPPLARPRPPRGTLFLCGPPSAALVSEGGAFKRNNANSRGPCVPRQSLVGHIKKVCPRRPSLSRLSASSGEPGCSQGKKRVFKTGSNLTTIASSSCSHNLRFCSYG